MLYRILFSPQYQQVLSSIIFVLCSRSSHVSSRSILHFAPISFVIFSLFWSWLYVLSFTIRWIEILDVITCSTLVDVVLYTCLCTVSIIFLCWGFLHVLQVSPVFIALRSRFSLKDIFLSIVTLRFLTEFLRCPHYHLPQRITTSILCKVSQRPLSSIHLPIMVTTAYLLYPRKPPLPPKLTLKNTMFCDLY